MPNVDMSDLVRHLVKCVQFSDIPTFLINEIPLDGNIGGYESAGRHEINSMTHGDFIRKTADAGNDSDLEKKWAVINMRIGGVEFADKYVMVSTRGKTGQKDIALVLSFRPLLEWYNIHPMNDDPDAPLWYSPWGTKCLKYNSVRKILSDVAKRAGIKKRVWAYLLCHTQLTELSKKLPDQLLRVYGNWSPSSKMTARYTHLSAQDAKRAILELHGIETDNPSHHAIQNCPRCGDPATPDRPVCAKCGYLLNDAKRAGIGPKDVARSRMHDKLLKARGLEEKIDAIFERVLSEKQAW